MVKIETQNQQTLEITHRDQLLVLRVASPSPLVVSIILTTTESEALENALRIYRREAERRAR